MGVYFQNEVHETGIFLSKSHQKGYPRHFHYYVEIFYLISGNYAAVVDNVEYKINQGDLLVVFPFQFHEYVDTGGNNSELVIRVDPELLNDYEVFFLKKYPRSSILRAGDMSAECKETIEWLIKTRHSETDVALLQKSLINTLFWCFTNQVEFEDISKSSLQTFRKVMKYCNEQCSEESFSLRSASKALGYGETYVSRMISQRLNMSFSSYINQLRIYRACKLLRKTDESITNIAYLCGYKTIRNFNDKFLKQMGQSPSDFRKANS